MNREEAIKIIDCYDIGFCDLSGEKIPADKLADAFDMAIEALQKDIERHEMVIRASEMHLGIVRCDDCKWRNRNWETSGCKYNPCVKPWFKDDYCSYGKRKGGGADD